MHNKLLLGVLGGFVAALGLFFVIAPNLLPENLVNNVVVMSAAALITGVFLWGMVWVVLRISTMKKEDVMRHAFLVGGVIVAVVFFVPGALTAWAMWNSPNALYFVSWKRELDLASLTFVEALTSGCLIVVSSMLAQIIVNNARSNERTGRVLFSLAQSFLEKDADLYHVRNFVDHPDDAHNGRNFWLFVLKFRMIVEELRRLEQCDTVALVGRAFEDRLGEAAEQAKKQGTQDDVSPLLELAQSFVVEDKLRICELPRILVDVMTELGYKLATGKISASVLSDPSSARVQTVFF